MSDLSYIIFASRRLMQQQGSQPLSQALDESGQCPQGALTVQWNLITGGSVDPVTGAQIGGVETPLSGTLTAIACEEAGRTVLRQFQEIKAGDLCVDLQPLPQIALFPGQIQSGVMPLSG